MKRVYLLVSIAATLLMVCLAVGVFYVLRTPTASRRSVFPTATLPPVSTATLSSTPTLTASPQPAFTATLLPTTAPTESLLPVIPKLAPGTELALDSLHMVNETAGWAQGGTGSDGHILYTQDGGFSWRDVTPSEPASPGSPGKRPFAFFLDANHAWVTYYPTDSPAEKPSVVWSTADGGATWQAGVPAPAAGMESYTGFDLMTFVDDQYGWLGLSYGAAAGSSPISVSRTVDGGASWQSILSPLSQASASLDACCRTGIVFLDHLTGLVTSANGAYPNAYVNWTRDGGITWESQDLTTTPPDQVDAPFCQAGSPQKLDSQSIAVVVECFTSSVDQAIQREGSLYITEDAGRNWTSSPLPKPSNEAQNWSGWQRSWRIQFLSGQPGYLFIEDDYQGNDATSSKTTSFVYQTNDRGKTWTLMGQTNWGGQFSFVNGQLGWAIARSGAEVALVNTNNGGLNWAIVKPTLIQP